MMKWASFAFGTLVEARVVLVFDLSKYQTCLQFMYPLPPVSVMTVCRPFSTFPLSLNPEFFFFLSVAAFKCCRLFELALLGWASVVMAVCSLIFIKSLTFDVLWLALLLFRETLRPENPDRRAILSSLPDDVYMLEDFDSTDQLDRSNDRGRLTFIRSLLSSVLIFPGIAAKSGSLRRRFSYDGAIKFSVSCCDG